MTRAIAIVLVVLGCGLGACEGADGAGGDTTPPGDGAGSDASASDRGDTAAADAGTADVLAADPDVPAALPDAAAPGPDAAAPQDGAAPDAAVPDVPVPDAGAAPDPDAGALDVPPSADAGDGGGGDGLPSGMGEACSTDADCAGFEADYCAVNPMTNEGRCTVAGCLDRGCPETFRCCDCREIDLPDLCVDAASAEGILAALCTCE